MYYGKDDQAKNLVGLAFCVAGPVNRIAPGRIFPRAVALQQQ